MQDLAISVDAPTASILLGAAGDPLSVSTVTEVLNLAWSVLADDLLAADQPRFDAWAQALADLSITVSPPAAQKAADIAMLLKKLRQQSS